MGQEVDDEPSWFDGRREARAGGLLAYRAWLIRSLEDEGIKSPANMRRIGWLSRALCAVEGDLRDEDKP